MPEGPEVRKYADALDTVLTGHNITLMEARTREARKWLQENQRLVVGRRIERVVSHGKNLIGYIDGPFFFHSHLMMWGRWETVGPQASTSSRRRLKPLALPEKDRRERARIVVDDAAAILLSAPIFNVGAGDPYGKVETLRTLGPDVLPYNEQFDSQEFQRRLLSPAYHTLEIGAALLNQQIVAGLGNYLRAEVLFVCKLNPWLRVSELSKRDLKCLINTIPRLAHAAYRLGATALEADRNRMAADSTLVYQQGREYGTRHMVFRRTNLPCLRCGERIKQLRQKTYNAVADGDHERSRIIYFCPKCQRVLI